MMPHNINNNNNNYYCYFSLLGNDCSYPKICLNELPEKGCWGGGGVGYLLLTSSFCPVHSVRVLLGDEVLITEHTHS